VGSTGDREDPEKNVLTMFPLCEMMVVSNIETWFFNRWLKAREGNEDFRLVSSGPGNEEASFMMGIN
jgi:hypothetical protein